MPQKLLLTPALTQYISVIPGPRPSYAPLSIPRQGLVSCLAPGHIMMMLFTKMRTPPNFYAWLKHNWANTVHYERGPLQGVLYQRKTIDHTLLLLLKWALDTCSKNPIAMCQNKYITVQMFLTKDIKLKG